MKWIIPLYSAIHSEAQQSALFHRKKNILGLR